MNSLFWTRSVFLQLFTIANTIVIITRQNQNFFKVVDNKKSPDEPLQTVSVSSQIHCAVICKKLEGCKAANFRDPLCELHGIVSRQIYWVDAHNWQYICK